MVEKGWCFKIENDFEEKSAKRKYTFEKFEFLT